MERREVNGVPVFFSRQDGLGEFELIFRCGMADEPIPHRGISHLTEHLALFGSTKSLSAVNGWVSIGSTSFEASGDPEELADFSRALCRSLKHPPYDRLEAEKRVLKIESETSQPSLGSRLMALRFGLRDAGMTQLPEFGLDSLTEEELADWIADWFVVENAVAVVAAPEFPDLEFDLPSGRRRPMSDPRDLSRLQLPCWVGEGEGVVGLGIAGSWNPATHLAAEVLDDALNQSLRFQDGIAYEVVSDFARVGPNSVHVTMAVPCRTGSDAAQVAAKLREVVASLAENGPEQELFDQVSRRRERALAQPRDRAIAQLHAAAANELAGGGLDFDRWIDEQAAMMPEQLREVFKRFADSAIMILPEDARPPADLATWRREVEVLPAELAKLPKFKPKLLSDSVELLIGTDGVVHETVDDLTSIPADEIAMALKISSGSYEIVGIDEQIIRVVPSDLKDPDAARAALDALLDGKIVEVEDKVGDRLRAMAAEKLDRSWTVKEALELAESVLDHDEEVENLCEASIGMKLGLLVVTDRNLIWLYTGMRDNAVRKIPRELIANPKIGGITSKKLAFSVDGEDLTLKNLRPKERAAELAAALGG